MAVVDQVHRLDGAGSASHSAAVDLNKGVPFYLGSRAAYCYFFNIIFYGLITLMDIYIIRRARLQELIETEYGGNQTELARAVGLKPPHINRWLSLTTPDRRPMTEPSARKIEENAGKPTGWLDATAEEWGVVSMFRELDESSRRLVIMQVQAIYEIYKKK